MMASNFSKLGKFKGVDCRKWQKTMHFLFSNMSVVYVLTTPMPEDGGDNPTMEQVSKKAKCILKHKKEELTLVELGNHLSIEECLRVQVSDKPKYNNVDGPSEVNMAKHKNSTRYINNKGKRKHRDNTTADPNKKAKHNVGNVAKLVTLKGIAKVLMLARKPMVQTQRLAKNTCKEEMPLNNNTRKQIGDFVDMPSEAVEKGMDANVPDEIDGAKGEQKNESTTVKDDIGMIQS
uniref:Zinc finger, CCHC-type n=1 Tax=Tanacetum cinerariifolium TaxID=118510 RepID=A0A6L2JCW6_TANCI|nr:zinc finger, CCHC-type [Tanacetum cinerariifolium]